MHSSGPDFVFACVWFWFLAQFFPLLFNKIWFRYFDTSHLFFFFFLWRQGLSELILTVAIGVSINYTSYKLALIPPATITGRPLNSLTDRWLFVKSVCFCFSACIINYYSSQSHQHRRTFYPQLSRPNQLIKSSNKINNKKNNNRALFCKFNSL